VYAFIVRMHFTQSSLLYLTMLAIADIFVEVEWFAMSFAKCLLQWACAGVVRVAVRNSDVN